MGQMTKPKKEIKQETHNDEEEEQDQDQEQEQDGLSVHSPCKITKTSPRKEKSDVDLELRLLEGLEIYPPAKLNGPHRHFLIYGLSEYMRRSFNRPFPAEEVMELLSRFYNLEMVKPDDEDAEFMSQDEDFRLPPSYFPKEET